MPWSAKYPKSAVSLRGLLILGLFILISLPAFSYARSSGTKLTRMPEVVETKNSQTMSLLESHKTSSSISGGNPELAIVDDAALSPESDTGEAFVDPGASGNGQISVYIVRKGDTLGTIAKMFGVSTNTILWANTLNGNVVHEGDELVILPISGVKHTVKSGDTVQSIAKKYGADVNDILSYNDLSTGAKLAVGDVVIVPDGELGAGPSSVFTSTSKPTSVATGVTNSCGLKVSTYERLLVNPCGYPSYPGYFIRPIIGGTKTQNLHGYNAVDIAAPRGTNIMAAADGKVIVAKSGGYNGGYGSYVVISHSNGTQTLYGHLSAVNVSAGQAVSQGQSIGALGNTGKSTGPHVHFEVRGAKNPF